MLLCLFVCLRKMVCVRFCVVLFRVVLLFVSPLLVFGCLRCLGQVLGLVLACDPKIVVCICLANLVCHFRVLASLLRVFKQGFVLVSGCVFNVVGFVCLSNASC